MRPSLNEPGKGRSLAPNDPKSLLEGVGFLLLALFGLASLTLLAVALVGMISGHEDLGFWAVGLAAPFVVAFNLLLLSTSRRPRPDK